MCQLLEIHAFPKQAEKDATKSSEGKRDVGMDRWY
jgi:hypothetical protein